MTTKPANGGLRRVRVEDAGGADRPKGGRCPFHVPTRCVATRRRRRRPASRPVERLVLISLVIRAAVLFLFVVPPINASAIHDPRGRACGCRPDCWCGERSWGRML